MTIEQMFDDLIGRADPATPIATPDPVAAPVVALPRVAAPTPPAATGTLARLPAALHAVAPHLPADELTAWSAALLAPCRLAGLVTVNTLAAFVGQVAEESGGFVALTENLHYSAARLAVVWPGRFTGPAGTKLAAACAGNPEALANAVYAGRLGNGDAASGDGWKFRGRGLIQITGRTATLAFAATVGMGPAECMDWMLTPRGAAASACWYWSQAYHRPALNVLAEAWDIEAITRAVNGGLTSYQARLAGSVAARKVLAG